LFEIDGLAESVKLALKEMRLVACGSKTTGVAAFAGNKSV